MRRFRLESPGGAIETGSAGTVVKGEPVHCPIRYLLALLSSRRLWPAPMTAPLAAFPPMAPIAAPFAAPLALGWAGSVFGAGCVAAGGGGAGFAGGVCAGDWGTAAIIMESPITIAEYFISPLLSRPPVSPVQQYLSHMRRRGPYLNSCAIYHDAPSAVWMFLKSISHAVRK